MTRRGGVKVGWPAPPERSVFPRCLFCTEAALTGTCARACPARQERPEPLPEPTAWTDPESLGPDLPELEARDKSEPRCSTRTLRRARARLARGKDQPKPLAAAARRLAQKKAA